MNLRFPAPFSPSRAVGTVAVLAGLTLATTCVQRAYAVVIVPNHLEVALTAGSGGYSTPITIPIIKSPVMVTGSTLTPANHRGTGSMHLTYSDTAPAAVSWAGVNSTGTTTAGITSAIQDDILMVGTGSISLGPALNQVRVRNTQAEGFSVQVMVEMIW